MKMRGRKIAYWVCVLLLVIPLGALTNYAEEVERAQPGALPGQIAAVGASLLLGAYIALYRLLPMFGREGRWYMRWPQAVLGAIFVALGLIVKRFYPYDSPMVSDYYRTWLTFGGFFLVYSIKKLPVPDVKQADGEQPGA